MIRIEKDNLYKDCPRSKCSKPVKTKRLIKNPDIAIAANLTKGLPETDKVFDWSLNVKWK